MELGGDVRNIPNFYEGIMRNPCDPYYRACVVCLTATADAQSQRCETLEKTNPRAMRWNRKRISKAMT